MLTLLVIDDEDCVRYSFRYVYEAAEVEVLTAETAEEGLRLAADRAPDVIVLDLQLPDRSGLELFEDLQGLSRKPPVIFITAHGTAGTAIEAMKKGAFDYLVKPLDLDQLSGVLDRALAAARLSNTPVVLPTSAGSDTIIARSRAMQEMCKAIGRLAPQEVNVLIVGESGSGKELVARALFQHSRRADRPFLALNCAAIPESLLESELFGHERGAFTGADRRRIGKFEQADGGTLFLDEIGDMPLSVQAKMLRILQDQRFERLGSNETVQTRVRVLAATNKDLEAEVGAGRFRADLYYRLKVVTLRVPPLRERLEEVPELAHHFLFRFDREMGMDVRSLAPGTLEVLQNHSWPGNVRELQGVIQQAMLNASGHVLLPEFLPPELLHNVPPPAPPTGAPLPDLHALVAGLLEGGEGDLYERVIQEVDRTVLVQVLQQTRGHQTRASEVLGMSRATLRHKLRTLGLAFDKVVTESGQADEDAE